jgi:hypothetical protein
MKRDWEKTDLLEISEAPSQTVFLRITIYCVWNGVLAARDETNQMGGH